ncbi:uncharacterized protein LOC119474477 [Sebastes umbrosus]|uniref:uncharacterized protein LOC119474477 n=1 Tax=Sebastes umbrosus TaxID=72105 RepID=UPI00189FAF0A|nr:uncharacterized protein LOC119474477 [Sebastes umbrosus]
MIAVFCIALNVILVSGSSLSDQVYQTPPDMYNKQEETATIKCSHSIDSYNRILWYKQTKDGQLKLLGYMLDTLGQPETGLGVKMEGSAAKDQTCTLTIERLNLSSSAVYFCAASLHSASYHCSSVQKPPHLSITAHSPSHLRFFFSSSLSDKVYMSPADIIKQPEETATIKCSHSIDSYNQILWYKQTKNGQLQLLGYMYNENKNPEPSIVDVKMDGNAAKDQTCTLTVEGLNQNSSGRQDGYNGKTMRKY